ncbi:DNA-processing protein DprA [Actinomyces radicidentis]|uniref:DNA-processing protein DprA n=2 Tax=Actinomyces radicidentis TaxID=111015 RepID=UPI000A70A7CA
MTTTGTSTAEAGAAATGPRAGADRLRRLLEAERADLLRASWSRLTEPADRAATALVTALGPEEATRWFLEDALDADGEPRSAPRPPLRPRGDASAASVWWARAAGRWAPRLDGLDVRREIEVLERLGGTLLVPGDEAWPEGLDELEHPPHCLWVRGDPRALTGGSGAGAPQAGRATGSGPLLAVVGARDASPYGERVASTVARELVEHGAAVVSGGAFGIDAAAHRGALAASTAPGPAGGAATTLAVSAGGVDRLYPAGNADLLRAVIAAGALVAEVPPGSQPARHRFLTRNRLIAALAGATVVVEAAWRSGALSTARHARDLGRPLGAVPGPVTSMGSVGCHRLLREGAVCVTDAAEALELVLPLGATDPDALKAADPVNAGTGLLDGLDGDSAAVLDALPARGSATPESLARAAGLSVRGTTAALGLLELAGRARTEGGRWRRA